MKYYIYMDNRITSAADYIKSVLDKNNFERMPEIAMILGSGLGDIAGEVQEKVVIPYKEIPDFPVSTAKGHAGNFVFGMLSGKPVLMMQGRFHFYEGYSGKDLIMPVRVMKLLGINKLIVTNAAGGVNRSFRGGDLMLINDHINYSGVNPLIGHNDEEFGPRFPDMTYAYDPELRETARKTAAELNIDLKEGVYIWFSGPSFETPAEIRMCTMFGADAVGMSTVPEVIAAVHCGIRVLGFSYITNMAAGITGNRLTHQEVLENAEINKKRFISLVKKITEKI